MIYVDRWSEYALGQLTAPVVVGAHAAVGAVYATVLVDGALVNISLPRWDKNSEALAVRIARARPVMDGAEFETDEGVIGD